jgi:hypothetical protein
MSSRRRPSVLALLVLATAGCITSTALFALTSNPIDPSLPLSVHARTGCLQGTVSYPGNVGNTTVQFVDSMFSSLCSGTVTQSGPSSSVSGTGSAKADLSAGTLRATATGRSLVDGTQALRAGSQVQSYLYDTLTVQGNWSGTRLVELRLAFDGSLTSNTPTPNWQSSFVSGGLLLLTEAGTLLGNGGVLVQQTTVGIPIIGSSAATQVTLTTNAINTVFDPADVRFEVSFVFPATVANRTFSFMARVLMGSGVGFATVPAGGPAEGVIDFGNSAQFSLIVPDDVTVTSASGQFLTAVPEPSTYGLMAIGLALVMGRAGKWRRFSR